MQPWSTQEPVHLGLWCCPRTLRRVFYRLPALHQRRKRRLFRPYLGSLFSVRLSPLVSSHAILLELPGHLIIILGVALLISSLEGTYSNPAVYLMIFSEIAVVASVMIAELHPQNQGDNLKERASLSGVMLVASALIMLIGLAALSLVTDGPTATAKDVADWTSNLPLIDLAQVWSPTMWFTAIAVGITLRGVSMFLSMQAISLVGGQNYVATIAALPFTSLLFELIADKVNYLRRLSLTPRPFWRV